MNVVVLGVGNVLMSDEGVGVHTVTAFEQAFALPDGVRCVDGGTSSQELLGDLENLDELIIVDAVEAGIEPAGLVRVEDDEVPAVFTTKLSPHQIGIPDMLAMLKFVGRGPKHVVLFGCEPVRLELDLEMSERVAARVPELCACVADELARIGLSCIPVVPVAAATASAGRAAQNLLRPAA